MLIFASQIVIVFMGSRYTLIHMTSGENCENIDLSTNSDLPA